MDDSGFVGLVVEGDRAGDGFEVSEADFDADSARVAVVFAESHRDVLGLACYEGADFAWAFEVGLEGVLV